MHSVRAVQIRFARGEALTCSQQCQLPLTSLVQVNERFSVCEQVSEGSQFLSFLLLLLFSSPCHQTVSSFPSPTYSVFWRHKLWLLRPARQSHSSKGPGCLRRVQSVVSGRPECIFDRKRTGSPCISCTWPNVCFHFTFSATLLLPLARNSMGKRARGNLPFGSRPSWMRPTGRQRQPPGRHGGV